MATGQGRGGNQPSTATTPSVAVGSGMTPEVKDDPALTRAANPDPGTRVVAVGTVGTRAPQRAKPFLSEGMRNDLETIGYAVDPVSGARYEVDDDGNVTVTEKATPAQVAAAEAPKGKTYAVDVEVTPPNTRVDPVTGTETVKDPKTGETRVTEAGSGVTTITDGDGDTRVVDDPRT